jgi:hypothetical protein
MARTTAGKVREVLLRDYDSVDEPSLTPFIDAAGALADDLEDAAESAPSASRLELIERWLAAHFYAMSDQPFSEEWVGKAKASYQGSRGETLGKYLEASKYGQQAILLDPTGYLSAQVAAAVVAAAGTRTITASATWLGKPPSQQTDYSDRD